MKKTSKFLSENFHFLVVFFSVHLNRLVFVMLSIVLKFIRPNSIIDVIQRCSSLPDWMLGQNCFCPENYFACINPCHAE